MTQALAKFFLGVIVLGILIFLTIQGLEHIEYLPVMDARNQSIPLASVRSTDINKAIQSALCRDNGFLLGLFIAISP